MEISSPGINLVTATTRSGVSFKHGVGSFDVFSGSCDQALSWVHLQIDHPYELPGKHDYRHYLSPHHSYVHDQLCLINWLII